MQQLDRRGGSVCDSWLILGAGLGHREAEGAA